MERSPIKTPPPWQNFHMPKLLDLKESHGKRGVTLPHTLPFIKTSDWIMICLIDTFKYKMKIKIKSSQIPKNVLHRSQ